MGTAIVSQRLMFATKPSDSRLTTPLVNHLREWALQSDSPRSNHEFSRVHGLALALAIWSIPGREDDYLRDRLVHISRPHHIHSDVFERGRWRKLHALDTDRYQVRALWPVDLRQVVIPNPKTERLLWFGVDHCTEIHHNWSGGQADGLLRDQFYGG